MIDDAGLHLVVKLPAHTDDVQIANPLSYARTVGASALALLHWRDRGARSGRWFCLCGRQRFGDLRQNAGQVLNEYFDAP